MRRSKLLLGVIFCHMEAGGDQLLAGIGYSNLAVGDSWILVRFLFAPMQFGGGFLAGVEFDILHRGRQPRSVGSRRVLLSGLRRWVFRFRRRMSLKNCASVRPDLALSSFM